MNRRAWGWTLAAPSLLFLLAFLALPLARTVAEGGVSLGVWREPYFLQRLGWTFTQAALSALAALLIGAPLAYLLARYRLPGGDALLRVLLLPFVTPTLVAALGLSALFGPRGLTGLDLSGTPTLLILGNLFFNLPLMIRLAYGGFARVPPELIGAARTLGAGSWRAALTVALPLALPGLLAGLTLVFLYSFLSFGLPLTLGGERYATLEVEIYTLTAYELRLPEASALILGQLAVTLAATATYLGLLRGASGVEGRRARLRPGPWAGGAAAGLGFVTLLICFGPLLAVVARSLTGSDGLTLAFWRGLSGPDNQSPLGLMLYNTVRFGLLALLGALLLGGLHALGAWWGRSRGLDLLSLLPLMVSPVSLAVGYLLLYPALTAQLGLLIAVYILLAAPLVTRSLLPALRALPPRLTEAARSLGSGPVQTFARVTLPLTLPALRGGAALALASVLGEFGATLVLTRPEWATLSIGMYQHLGRPGLQNLGEACALATVLMLLALASFTLLDGGRGEVT